MSYWITKEMVDMQVERLVASVQEFSDTNVEDYDHEHFRKQMLEETIPIMRWLLVDAREQVPKAFRDDLQQSLVNLLNELEGNNVG